MPCSILLLPNTEYATTEQVAEYYNVGKEVVRQIVTRNNDEFESDGLKYLKGKEIKEKYNTYYNMSQVPKTLKVLKIHKQKQLLN